MKKKVSNLLISCVLVIVSLYLVFLAYKKFEYSPWTRHGIVKADIIKLAPEVNGKIKDVYVVNNQKVKKGDLLFRIDQRSYRLKRNAAKVGLRKAYQDFERLEAGVRIAESRLKSSEAVFKDAKKNKRRDSSLYSNRIISEKSLDATNTFFDKAASSLDAAKAALIEAQIKLGEKGNNNIMIQAAIIKLEQAELNLSYTEVRAPVDGNVVNVEIHPGDYVVAGKPVMAVVDANSVHVMAAFKETQLEAIKVGDKANIILMSMKKTPLTGKITSIGRAIDPKEYLSSNSMVPTIPASFDWVRLAQRVPIEIKFENLENKVHIIPGTTASVSIIQSPKS